VKLSLFPKLFTSALLVCALAATTAPAHATATTPSFAVFDKRAKAGEHLTVVFFGCSLTWGANASDPQLTSYRADVAQDLTDYYPNAHFTFRDAAIGGTNSQLGVFRCQRDVLDHNPDLVFLDFAANDDVYTLDPETMASYESLVRRILLGAHCPIEQVIFPFKYNIKPGEMDHMKGRDAKIALAAVYNLATGDAIKPVYDDVLGGTIGINTVWPFDGAHPGDKGYALFSQAVWSSYLAAVKAKLVCKVPDHMVYADTYMNWARVPISTLGTLPAGWRIGLPYRTSAWYDGLMSRWLGPEAIASSNMPPPPDDHSYTNTTPPAPLTVTFHGSMVFLFGEETIHSGQYHVYIDGVPATRKIDNKGDTSPIFDPNSAKMGGTRQHAQVIATGLDPSVVHTLKIEPVFDPTIPQELRIESICVAGGPAGVGPIVPNPSN